MSMLRYVVLLATGSFLSGCSTPHSRAVHEAEHNPVTVEAALGGDYLLSLREQSRVSKGAHGEIRFDFGFPLPKEIAYPFSPTFQISVKGQSFTNHYTVQRETKDSAWQLQRAWQTDSEGRTVKEWPTK
jgi:hypothetical protein